MFLPNRKKDFDNRHGAKPLPELQTGTPVLIKTDNEKKWKQKGTIIKKADKGRCSYIIDTPNGQIRHNRKHIQELPQTHDTTESDHDDIYFLCGRPARACT